MACCRMPCPPCKAGELQDHVVVSLCCYATGDDGSSTGALSAEQLGFSSTLCIPVPHLALKVCSPIDFAVQGDAEKVTLRATVLTPEQQVGCAARWQADCARFAVERAGFWMNGDSSASSAASSAPGASSGAAAAAPQLPEVPAGTGYVSLGGIPVPSRAAQAGTQSARQFVRTPSAEQHLQACALVLCQQRPLLLEGPPGAPFAQPTPCAHPAQGSAAFVRELHWAC